MRHPISLIKNLIGDVFYLAVMAYVAYLYERTLRRLFPEPPETTEPPVFVPDGYGFFFVDKYFPDETRKRSPYRFETEEDRIRKAAEPVAPPRRWWRKP